MSCGESKPQNCCSPAVSVHPVASPFSRRLLEVEVLYLDLQVCERCQGTEAILKEAVEEANRILGPTGVDVALKMTHVVTEDQAKELGFLSSPTIRLMGRDSAIEVKENPCAGCSTVGGCDINCRVWTWQGREYSVPPKAMILDAILREAYLHPAGERKQPPSLRDVPENIHKFFLGARNRQEGR